MSENISLTLSATRLETATGESVEITLTVRNLSLIVDRYLIKVEGLDPTWWTLSVPTVSLFPNDHGEAKLTIHPPRDAEAKAGSYSLRIKAISEADPQEITVVEALLILRGFVVYEVEMSPTKIVGRSGTYSINIRNSGNTDAVIVFEGKDAEEALLFSFDYDKVTVPAGASSKIRLTVRPKKGVPQTLYTFQILSRQGSKEKTLAKDAQTLVGQLEYPRKRRFPWWLTLAAAGIIIATIIIWQVFARSVPENNVTITSPTGGERWLASSTQSVTWKTTKNIGSSSSIQLEYSTDNGRNWLNITTAKVGVSSHVWEIPDTPSSSCLVRVTVRSATNEVLTQDISDTTFSILSTVSKELSVDIESSGKEVTLATGGILVVTLDSNYSTGYGWNANANIDDKTVIQQTDHKYLTTGTGEAGAGGKEVWTFKALKAGKSTILMEYRQPFNPNATPAKRFTLTVIVQ